MLDSYCDSCGKITFRKSGYGSGESGSATTSLAPASVGADAHANHESVAGAGDERGLSLEEKTIQRTRTSTVRETPLAPWASRRRQELLELLDRMNPTIEELTAAAEREARKRPEALRLMTQEIVEQHVMSRETADLFDSIIDSACFQTH
jgi:hypothetical protein